MLIVSGGGESTQIYNDDDGWTVIQFKFTYGLSWPRLVTLQNRVLFFGKYYKYFGHFSLALYNLLE